MKYSDELYHFGIKGMKWGRRRFQNKDGSYTKQGLARERANDHKQLTDKERAARRKKISTYARNAAVAAAIAGGAYLYAKKSRQEAAYNRRMNADVASLLQESRRTMNAAKANRDRHRAEWAEINRRRGR